MIIIGICIGGVIGLILGFTLGVKVAMDFLDNCEKENEQGRN